MANIGNMNFNFDTKANAWSSGVTQLTGNTILELTLPKQGRIVVRKSNTGGRPWPIVLASPYTGPDFQVYIHGQAKGKYIIIETTAKPSNANLYNV